MVDPKAYPLGGRPDPPPDEERCIAETAQGNRCSKRRMDGSKYCHIHQKDSAQMQRKFTQEKKEVFLRAVKEAPVLSMEAASAIAGISKTTVYHHSDPEHSSYDEDFAARFERAKDLKQGVLEKEAYKTATGKYGDRPYWPALKWAIENLSDELESPQGQQINVSQKQEQKQEEKSVNIEKAAEQFEELIKDLDDEAN